MGHGRPTGLGEPRGLRQGHIGVASNYLSASTRSAVRLGLDTQRRGEIQCGLAREEQEMARRREVEKTKITTRNAEQLNPEPFVPQHQAMATASVCPQNPAMNITEETQRHDRLAHRTNSGDVEPRQHRTRLTEQESHKPIRAGQRPRALQDLVIADRRAWKKSGKRRVPTCFFWK